MFISLSLLILLSLLNSLINSFLYIIYSLNKLYYFVLRELFINTYKFINYKL